MSVQTYSASLNSLLSVRSLFLVVVGQSAAVPRPDSGSQFVSSRPPPSTSSLIGRPRPTTQAWSRSAVVAVGVGLAHPHGEGLSWYLDYTESTLNLPVFAIDWRHEWVAGGRWSATSR